MRVRRDGRNQAARMERMFFLIPGFQPMPLKSAPASRAPRAGTNIMPATTILPCSAMPLPVIKPTRNWIR